MSDSWWCVTLACPVCRRPVEALVDDLVAGKPVVCPRGHALPAIDLACSGLSQAMAAIAAIAEPLEKHGQDDSKR